MNLIDENAKKIKFPAAQEAVYRNQIENLLNQGVVHAQVANVITQMIIVTGQYKAWLVFAWVVKAARDRREEKIAAGRDAARVAMRAGDYATARDLMRDARVLEKGRGRK